MPRYAIYLVGLISFFGAVLPLSAEAAATIRPTNSGGLMTWWKFEDGTGTTVADASGGGNPGTITGSPTWVSGKTGQALQFSSSGQYVSRTVNASATSYTVSAWIQYNGAVPISSIKVAFSYGSGASGTIWMGYASNGRLAVSNSSVDLTSSTVINDTNWHHVAVVVSGGAMTGYADGVSLGSQSIASRPGNTLKVGDYTSSGFAFTGKVDDVRVYNRALSAAEISALSGAQTTKVSSGASLSAASSAATGLAGYWSFDGADVTDKVYDRVGGNHGYYSEAATSSAKVAGNIGQALRFNGASYVRVGSAFGQPTNMAISLWFKTAAVGGAMFGQADGFPSGVPTSYVPALAINTSGQLRGELWTNSVAAITSAGSVADNRWHHAVLMNNGTTQSMYLDGVLVGTRSGTLVQSWWTLSQVGTGYDSNNRGICTGWCYFNGAIDEVRVYNRSLTAAEAAQLYRAGAVRQNASSILLSSGSSLTNNLVGHWTFDGADFTTSIADKSGQGAQAYLPSGISTSSAKTAGKLGQALRLNGSSCAITPTSLNNVSAFTLSGWVNAVSAGNRIGFFGQNDVIELGFVDSDTIGGWTSGGSATASWDFTASSFPFNTWNHVALTGSASGVSLYVNGSLVASATGAANFGTSAFKLNIGGCGVWDNTGNGLTGGVDDVRVYTRMLGGDEVKQLYLMGGTGGPRVPAGGGSSPPPGNEAA